ncbi:chaplin [Streptomyces sp. NPDC050147]|uniref:chaplin n=1 Tax=Streptomyces sp. NPDC050147 TaxID=3155513 RepID=UPI0034279FA4
MLATAAATSILSLSGSDAFAADADAVTAGSPGILSGNSVQAPVEVPVNACGNTANVVGAANPSFGNKCANTESVPKAHTHAPERVAPQERQAHGGGGYGHTHSGAHHGAQSTAKSHVSQSPGILSGNNVQAPAHVPVNACGNTVDVVGLFNPVMGNGCANEGDAPTPPHHETPHSPKSPPRSAEPPADRAVPPTEADKPRHVASSTDGQLPRAAHEEPSAFTQLAETGSDVDYLAAAAASTALLIGGGILYRRGRATSRR